MKTFLLSCSCLFATLAVAADLTLPVHNQGAWTVGTAAGTPGTGIPGGIEQHAAGGVNDRAVTGAVIDITQAPYSADPTGVADCKAALQAAISATVPWIPTVIYFPAGRYRFSSGGLGNGTGGSQKTNFTIRGAGVGVTTFELSFSGVFFTYTHASYINYAQQTVTGTKTKGTTALSVADASEYSAGMFVAVGYENEVDSARIMAGSPPVWSSKGWPFRRRQFARVTSAGSGVINIDPGLSGDATHLELVIARHELATWRNEYIGVEDLSIEFDPANHPTWGFNVNSAAYCWFYRVHFKNWSRDSDNYSPIKFTEAYRCEVRKCRFDAVDGSSSDGAIETVSTTSCAIVDNIFTGDFGLHLYDSGNSTNNVIAYNFSDRGTFTGLHDAHPTLILYEGNSGFTHHSDAYHGSSSDNTLYRNDLRGGNSIILNRLKRRYFVAGNFLGRDGTTSGGISWGNPNMSNGNANGFAGPTGGSDQVGELDYQQNGGSPYTYEIQPADVFVGDFWQDWEVTGTLDTRTSDTVGIFTVSGGDWFVGASPTGASNLLIIGWWNSKASYMENGSVTHVAGDQVTVSWGSGSLPTVGTSFQFYFGPAGWQERDLDVQASTVAVHNYYSNAGGVGEIRNITSDTLPASLSHSAKPAWFGDKPWPPFDVDDVETQDITRLPAGHRFVYGNEDYLGGGGGGGGTTVQINGTLNVGTLVIP